MLCELHDISELREAAREHLTSARWLLATHRHSVQVSRTAIEQSRDLLRRLHQEERRRQPNGTRGHIEPISRVSGVHSRLLLERPPIELGTALIRSWDTVRLTVADPLTACKRMLRRLVDSPAATMSLSGSAGDVVNYYWEKLSSAQRGSLRRWLSRAVAASRRLSPLQSLEATVRQSQVALGALKAATDAKRGDSAASRQQAAAHRPFLDHRAADAGSTDVAGSTDAPGP